MYNTRRRREGAEPPRSSPQPGRAGLGREDRAIARQPIACGHPRFKRRVVANRRGWRAGRGGGPLRGRNRRSGRLFPSAESAALGPRLPLFRGSASCPAR